MAHERARSDGVKFVGVDHIMAVLLKCRDKDLEQAMKRLGIVPSKVIADFELPYQCFPKMVPSGTLFSKGAENAIRASAKKAASRNENVCLVDLLYGILKAANPLGTKIEALGLPPDVDIEVLYSV